MPRAYSHITKKYYNTLEAKDRAEKRSARDKALALAEGPKITEKTDPWVGTPTPIDQPPWAED